MDDKHRTQSVQALPEFPELEREILRSWEKKRVVKEYLQRNKNSKEHFSFIDGPITANNPMGVHHGWGRTYKDLWQRFHNMKGLNQRFQNGFDAQGLWVEVEVEKELGFKSKKEIEKYGVEKFVEKCKQRVFKYAKIQTEQSKRLGYFMDWDHSYYTLSDENNYMIWHFLKICHENGWLYKGKDSVPWCPRCETAISQHEMLTEDYSEVTHESIYLSFPITQHEGEYLVVWTTTPWTIPANIAVAVDKKLNYALVEVKGKRKYWVAKDVVARLFQHNKHTIRKVVKGSELVGMKYTSPFDELPAVKKVAESKPKLFHSVIPTDTRILPITTTEGTGLVHTAVSAGSEDFRLGKKIGLPMIPVINDDASYLSGLGFLSGKNAKKHPEVVLNYLNDLDDSSDQHWVVRREKYSHRYPTCWRCKTELVWKVTDEWYIAMDKGRQTLRERMKRVAGKIRWIPPFGLERELDWLKNMNDWLISKKNRYWGLCLPIWECGNCGAFEVIGSKEELKKRAAEGWKAFEGKSPHKPHIDKVKIVCSSCGELVSRIEPVGNPWLDAGIVPFSTIAKENQGIPLYKSSKREWAKWFPADFITESFPGQFKNWFYSLIAMSTVMENRPPVKTILGFATLLGEDGRAMHKSWGNAVEFNEGANKIGVDVMRWMYLKQEPTQNLLFGYKRASEVRRQFHLLLWNSHRFVVNNMEVDGVRLDTKTAKPRLLDRWIISRLHHTADQVSGHLQEFNAREATASLEKFVQDLSTWYIRRSRKRVGPTSQNETSKWAFYQTSHEVMVTLVKLLAPFIPFLSEAMFWNLTGKKSVHLENWPVPDRGRMNAKLEGKMQVVREVVELGHAERKQAKIKVRQPLASLTVSGCRLSLEDELLTLISDELNVKEVRVGKTGKKLKAKLNTALTDELVREGEARELVRQIQKERKRLGTNPDDQVVVTAPNIPVGFEQEIRLSTRTSSLRQASRFSVKKAP